ncbi:MAG: TSUP family transporter [Acetobacteraceae bacterium]|nr:TSUP family transporter [Acetobacteraceae bacterium]
MVCSVIAQCQTIPAIWQDIDFRHIWPILVAGIIGVPIGTSLLAHVNAHVFRLGAGVLLVLFSTTMLLGRARITFGGAAVSLMQ